MAWLPASGHPANRQVVERRDGIGLCPQPHSAGLEACIAVVEIELAVKPRLHVIANRDQANRMPLAELGCSHTCCRDLAAPAIVVVEPEIAFERVGPHDVVLAV